MGNTHRPQQPGRTPPGYRPQHRPGPRASIWAGATMLVFLLALTVVGILCFGGLVFAGLWLLTRG